MGGNRQALIRESRPGDLIVFIGTETDETAPEERGRLLGIAEIGRIEIEAADAIDLSRLDANAFDENGQLRWPKALPMLRAWRFVNRPEGARGAPVLRGTLELDSDWFSEAQLPRSLPPSRQ